jgi:tight adherence protein B
VRRRFGIAASAALIAAAALVTTSSAAPRIQLSPTTGVNWPDRGYLLSLGSSQRIQPSQVTVTENGKAVNGASVQPAGSARATFGTMLVIDASDSMRGAPIRGAVTAARAFAARRNVNQRLAVLTFNSSNHYVLPFTGNEARIRAALSDAPKLAHGTHLYDAGAKAITLMQAARISGGAVVLLTDGADTGSSIKIDELTKIAEDAHIRMFTVGLRSSTFRPAALEQIAGMTGGSFSQAGSSGELAGIFDQLGLKLANEYLVTYRSLLAPGHKVQVNVTVAGRGTAKAAYKAPPVPIPAFDQPFGDRMWQSWVTMLLFAVLFASLIGVALFAALRPPGSTVRKRLSDFVSTARPTEEESREALASRIFEETERSLEETRWWRSFKEALELAEVKIPPVQILAGTLVLTLFVMWLLGTIIAWPLALLGLAVPFAVRGVITRRIDKKRRAFDEQLPDNLDVVASGLRAGHSIVGALSLVVHDASEPSKTEFQRVVADEQLGVPLEDALEVVARRMKSRDIEQVALVASLQRETGGNSAEVLDRVTESIRERAALRRLVRGLTAQGRMSRWVVSALPVGLLLVISLLNPAYMKPLFTHTSGKIMLTFAATMIVAGSLVIKKIVDIKV